MSRKVFVHIMCLIFVGVFIVQVGQADVKLRVYLKDGTLQAGNLVSETDKSFVILTKTGREEIQKENIMFINGKTLAQWQARPDKLFQTEIIPSEIPNPAYVNDKSKLPIAVPKIEGPISKPIVPIPVPPPVTQVKPVEVKKEEPLLPAAQVKPVEVKKEAPSAPSNPHVAAAPVVHKSPARKPR